MKSLIGLFLICFSVFPVISQTKNTDDYREYLNRSLELISERKPDQAVDLLTEAITKFPTEHLLYLRRAEIHRFQNKYDLYERDLLKVAEIAHDKADILTIVANYLSMAKKCNLAIETINKAINIYPTNQNLYLSRASFYLCSKDNVSALNDVNFILSLNPQNMQALSFRKWLLAEIGNRKPDSSINNDLIAKTEEKFKKFPEDNRTKLDLAYLYQNRARYFEKENNFEEMFNDYDRIIEIMPFYFNFYERGKKLLEYKHYEKAILDFRKVLEMKPEMWDVYLDIGDSYFGLKNYDKAITEYKNALKMKSASKARVQYRIDRVEREMSKDKNN